jgi:Ni/Co efflux regulator RcnB
VFTLSGGLAFAQGPRGNQRYVRHNEWKKGSRINPNGWNWGQQVEYRGYQLHAPPHGYQWREVDGNYVLAAVATGVIASVIVAADAH